MAKKRIKYFCMLMSDILMVYLSDLLAWGLLFGFTEISKHWTFWRVLVILPLTVIIFECSMYVGKIRRNMGTQIGSKDVFCTAISDCACGCSAGAAGEVGDNYAVCLFSFHAGGTKAMERTDHVRCVALCFHLIDTFCISRGSGLVCETT